MLPLSRALGRGGMTWAGLCFQSLWAAVTSQRSQGMWGRHSQADQPGPSCPRTRSLSAEARTMPGKAWELAAFPGPPPGWPQPWGHDSQRPRALATWAGPSPSRPAPAPRTRPPPYRSPRELLPAPAAAGRLALLPQPLRQLGGHPPAGHLPTGHQRAAHEPAHRHVQVPTLPPASVHSGAWGLVLVPLAQTCPALQTAGAVASLPPGGVWVWAVTPELGLPSGGLPSGGLPSGAQGTEQVVQAR